MGKLDPKQLPAVIPDSIRDPSPHPAPNAGADLPQAAFRVAFYAVFEG